MYAVSEAIVRVVGGPCAAATQTAVALAEAKTRRGILSIFMKAKGGIWRVETRSELLKLKLEEEYSQIRMQLFICVCCQGGNVRIIELTHFQRIFFLLVLHQTGT